MTAGATYEKRIPVTPYFGGLGAAATALFLFTGCQGSKPPDTAHVSGTVKVSGKPLAKVHVKFIPEGSTGDKVLCAVGTTDAQGKYKLLCDDGREGTTLGWHKVVITYDSRAAERQGNPFEAESGKAGPRVVTSPIPEKYTSVTTTPFRFEVKPGENPIDLTVD